nr:hypothetical protein [Kibdelosporangium sp. MJ126-NF4]
MAMRPSAWSSSLVPDGILAVLTHGQRTPARFHDPANALVQAAHRDGLKYLDRIAVLQAPIEQRDSGISAPPAVHARVHADLHIFSNTTTDATVAEDGRA